MTWKLPANVSTLNVSASSEIREQCSKRGVKADGASLPDFKAEAEKAEKSRLWGAGCKTARQSPWRDSHLDLLIHGQLL